MGSGWDLPSGSSPSGSLSTATVYGWVKAGKLPHMHLAGNIIRIPIVVVERLLAASVGR
jgi:hypothetical protein